MHFNDHTPPHFHVYSAGDEAQVRIYPVEVMNGKLDRKHLVLIKSGQLCTGKNSRRTGGVRETVPH